jgi:hypothetical protein
VFVQIDAVSGNVVAVYDRAADGTLRERPEGPAPRRQRLPVPVGAMSAQVKLAITVCSVRRGDRGSAPVTCLIHFQSSGSILTRPAL